MQNDKDNNIIRNVLDKIESNELKPKSRAYFRAKLALVVLVALATLVVTVLLASFIIFSVRATGQATLIGFGASGTSVFIALFPWRLLVIDIILAIILQVMLRQFKFGYKIPVVYLLGVVAIMLMASAVLADRLHVHDRIMRYGEMHPHPSTFDRAYGDVRKPPAPPCCHGIYRGMVVGVGTSTLTLELDDPRATTTVKIRVHIPNRYLATQFEVGDRLFISGLMHDGDFDLDDFRKAPGSRK